MKEGAPRSLTEKERTSYSCAFKNCTNSNLKILEETDSDILVWCDKHQVKTYHRIYREVKKPQIIKPRWKISVDKWKK